MAPIELTRAQALLSSSRLDLIRAEGEYRQQEVIFREQLLRRLGDPVVSFASIVPTDRILVPDTAPIGSPGTGQVMVSPDITQGGLELSTIYQAGLQLSIPLRNRIAQSDAVRDAIQLRQSQGRNAKLENGLSGAGALNRSSCPLALDKAQLALDRALGNLLKKNNIVFDDAI